MDGVGANLDLYATFASLIDRAEPMDAVGYLSQDLSGTLLEGSSSPRSEWLYLSATEAYRSGKYKIHFSSKDRGLILIQEGGCLQRNTIRRFSSICL